MVLLILYLFLDHFFPDHLPPSHDLFLTEVHLFAHQLTTV